jgi:hypothetical protein
LEKTNSGARIKKNPKAICAAKKNPGSGFLYLILYIEAFKCVKSKTPNPMGKVKRESRRRFVSLLDFDF